MTNIRTFMMITSALTIFCMLLILSLSAITRGKILLSQKSSEHLFVEKTLDYNIVSKKELYGSTVTHQYLLNKDDQQYYGFILKPKNNLDGLLAIYNVTGTLVSIFYMKPSIYATNEETIKNHFDYGLPFISNRVTRFMINPTYQALYQAYNLILEEPIK